MKVPSVAQSFVMRARYIFDREHTMRKRSYNLVCCCCWSGHLTLLSKEEN